MALPSDVVERRARLLARLILIFDLFLAVAFFLAEAALPFWIVLVVNALLALFFPRFLRRAPALSTLGMLSLSAFLLATAPYALGAIGVSLWLLVALIPMLAGFVLGRRKPLWQMAVITSLIAGLAAIPFFNAQRSLAFDLAGVAALLAMLAVSIWAAAWLTARALRPDPSNREILGLAMKVVRGVIVVPFNWVVGGVQSEALQLELHQLKRRHNPRWIVLDLAPAGELGGRDLNAIDQAAQAVSTSHCTIVLARPPVDALGHLDVARPVAGRVERFATVTQAVEAGLRRLGWAQPGQEKRELESVF